MAKNSATWKNPFSMDRLEDWRVEEFPKKYEEIVACFAPPDFMNKLEDPSMTKALIIMGGRGSGKSHILRMMSTQSVIKDIERRRGEHNLSVKHYDKPYFGVYIKTNCFSPLSTENITYLTVDELKPLFEHLFNLQIGKSILGAVDFFCSNLSDIPPEVGKAIRDKLCASFSFLNGDTHKELIASLENEIEALRTLVKLYPYERDFSSLSKKLHFTNTPYFISNIYDIVRNEIPILQDTLLFLLLDEYEEMDTYQQEFINRLIKDRELIFRIASKTRGIKTINYGKNETLNEVHDYEIIPLHFDVSVESRAPYRALAESIFRNRLRLFPEYLETEPKELLPPPTLEDEKITQAEIDKELQKIRTSLKKKKEISGDNLEKYWMNFEGHYREAAIYRLLKQKGKDKLYAGFYEYVALSSGIVRLFLWLCREAFQIAHQNGVMLEEGEPINVDIQSKAARAVSKRELFDTIPQNANSAYSRKMVRLIHDIGSILRAKLHHSTQPQANRIEIKNSEKLESEEFRTPREIINCGLDLPVFLTEAPFKPRASTDPVPETFSLNWILAPSLQIPPEKRWRTEITAEELNNLCSTENRNEALGEIIKRIEEKTRRIRRKGKQGTKGQLYLIEPEKDIASPIDLSNCPYTGMGCNQQLTETKEHKSFLAVPFDPHSWVKDPRTWIKECMYETHKIPCYDVDDFPEGTRPIICKLCSCVRQYPIGLFEMTELNANVIFELGMAIALNRLMFLLVYKDKIPVEHKDEFLPKPLDNVVYISYDLGRNEINQVIEEKILPVIESRKQSDDMCGVINGKCRLDSTSTISVEDEVFVALPFNIEKAFYKEVGRYLKALFKRYEKKTHIFHPANSIGELCQMCIAIKKSSFCVIDTTSNNTSMLIALGMSFGKDKKFIQLHNVQLSPERPISDLRRWAIEYENLEVLQNKLDSEIPQRLSR